MRSKPFAQGRFEDLPEKPRLPHAYFEARSREVVVPSRAFGDVRTHVVEMGEGEPLLLVHGLMTSSYSWRYVIAPLARRHRVIAPDLPGAGKTDKPDARYGIDALATWIGELQRALGVEGCACVGNSLGGLVCMRRALDEPRSFAKLVNVHSPAVPIARLHALGLAFKLPGATSIAARIMQRDPIRWAHKNVHYRDESLKSLEEAKVYGEPLATDAGARAFFAWMRDALATEDLARFVADLERLRHEGRPFPTPLLLLYAKTDPMVPPAVGASLASLIPSAKMIWLEESSHFAHVDTPALFVEHARAFFDS